MADTATTSESDAATESRIVASHHGSHWIEHWEPEDPTFWKEQGKGIATRNLVFSIFAEHIGFSVWLLWSIVVVQMTVSATGAAAPSGFALSTSQALTLTAVASGVGAFLRLPYTFAVPIFGGRNWTVVSALLLLIPCGLMAWAVGNPDTPFWALVLVAATAGFGGGNFASSMANISFFYPEKEKGWALGLNAAGGNVGVAVAQKVVPLVVAAGGGLALARAGYLYIPFAILAAVGAWLFMDNLSEAKADVKPVLQSLRHRDTWIMSLLYIGTFGSFIGYSAAFPSLLKAVFDRGDIALTWAFLGAGIGSVARPLGGRLSDVIGGARVTLVSFLMLALGASAALWSVQNKSLTVFFVSFMFLFVATGIGNGSTYRMISRIFQIKGQDAGGAPETMVQMRRQAAGALGIISSVGAFGGFVVPLAYAWSKDHYGNIQPALKFYIAFFVVLLAVTWISYVRRGTRMGEAGV
ncbi:NarK family nitrate/nitrite MFS transporter [Spongisporangium articulatum]|uniref:Nitrate/nitrite transporter n=1 Tax=Spongisporangium articulatum TaxID=3362603 RepID=A0ABW8AIE6_9ACTN